MGLVVEVSLVLLLIVRSGLDGTVGGSGVILMNKRMATQRWGWDETLGWYFII